MRIIISGLLLSIIFIGCGYKADPIYIDSKKSAKGVK